MKIFAWFLILFHIAVALFWIGNSSYLFSKGEVMKIDTR